MENIYITHETEIQKRRVKYVKLKSELEQLEDKLSKIEPNISDSIEKIQRGEACIKPESLEEIYYNLVGQIRSRKAESENYTWIAFTEKEFREWYMKANEDLFESLKGEVICDSCSTKIQKPEDIRSHGGLSYHPKCFMEYARKELQDKHTDDHTREFLLRSLWLSEPTDYV